MEKTHDINRIALRNGSAIRIQKDGIAVFLVVSDISSFLLAMQHSALTHREEDFEIQLTMFAADGSLFRSFFLQP